MSHPERPPTVECAEWEPDPADPARRRCRNYLAGERGFCQLEAHFTCSEWDRKFAVARGLPTGPSARTSAGTHPPLAGSIPSAKPPPADGPADFSTAPPIHDLIAEPLHLPPSAKTSQNANGAAESSFVLRPTVPEPPKLGGGRKVGADPNAVIEGPPPDFTRPEEVAGLEASGMEVGFAVEGVLVHPPKPLVLVGARTGRSDRHELTYRDLAALRWIVDTFEGARVTAITFGAVGERTAIVVGAEKKP